MAAEAHRVGILILRAWREDPPDPLRVRVTSTLDVANDPQTETVVVTVTEAVELVREWLEPFSNLE